MDCQQPKPEVERQEPEVVTSFVSNQIIDYFN